MKYNNILYLTDDTIFLKNKKKELIKYKINSGIISNGKICHINKFIKTYEKVLKDNHLNNSLFGETIKIIVNFTYTNADINILKNIFSCFNYRKVIVDYENKYYKLNTTNSYITIYDGYQIISYLNEYKKEVNIFLDSNMFFNIDDLMKYLKYQIKDKVVFLIGKGEKLKEVFKNFEDKYGNVTYMFSNNETYIISHISRK